MFFVDNAIQKTYNNYQTSVFTERIARSWRRLGRVKRWTWESMTGSMCLCQDFCQFLGGISGHFGYVLVFVSGCIWK